MIFFKERTEAEQKATVTRRGVIYARYSSEMQDTSDSIEVQVSECKKYALANRILIVREPFIDTAETGTVTENRKRYQELLRIAQRPERNFDTILTFHTSRWGRGIESEIDEYLLEKNGIKIISVSQSFTADDAIESMFMKGIMRKIDAYYSMQASKYTHAYQSSNATNGFKNGGAAPDGYVIEHVPTGKKDKYGEEKMKSRLALDTKPGKYDRTDQPRHKLIEFAFMAAHAGRGIRWISKEITRLGWRSRYSDAPVSAGNIRTWFVNPSYTGYMVWNRVKFYRKNGKRNYTHNPISKWVFSDQPSHLAIVPKDLFEGIAIQFLRRRERKGRPRAESDVPRTAPENDGRYLLTGLLRCAQCRSYFVAARNLHRKKKTHIYYVCNTKWRRGKAACASSNINMAVAEGAILEALFNIILTEDEIKKFIEAFNEFVAGSNGRSQEEQTQLLREKAKINQEMARLKEAILAGADARSFAVEVRDRQTALDRLDQQLALAKDMGDGRKIRYEPERLAAWVKSLRNNFMAADFEIRKQMLKQFVEEVNIKPDRSAVLKWNPQAVLTLVGGQGVPGTAMMVMKNQFRGRI